MDNSLNTKASELLAQLKIARQRGNELAIALAEAALNDLLDRASDVTRVTRNVKGDQK